MTHYICSFLCDWQLWLSVVPIGISLVAIIQTGKQVHLSNKLGLFDKRMAKYLLFRQLTELYLSNKTLLRTTNDGIECVPDYYAGLLTNCANLEGMMKAFDETISNPQEHKNFLIKLETLKNSANEIRLLWSNKHGRDASRFVEAYAEFLFKLYQQQITIHTARKQNVENHTIDPTPIIQNAAKYNELYGALEKLNAAYENLIKRKCDKKLINKITI